MPLAAPKGTRHLTKQEFVYQTLREAILKCELPPGERLVIDDLARQLQVSAIPVREALQLLLSEGLVVNVPHVGATVAPISRESILEVFTVMEGLEIVSTRVAALRATEAEVQTLAEIVSQMDRALGSGDHEGWAELNKQFHLSISGLAQLPMLQEMMERVFDRWERVRRFYFSGVLVHRADQAQAEHHEIIDTIRARNVEKLEGMIRRHNQGGLDSYTSYLDKHTGR
jgi:DNA-binding GntR family transcriptional regulator